MNWALDRLRLTEQELKDLRVECALRALSDEPVPGWQDSDVYGPDAVEEAMEQIAEECEYFDTARYILECSAFPCILMAEYPENAVPDEDAICTGSLPFVNSTTLVIGDDRYWVVSIAPRELQEPAAADQGRRVRDFSLGRAWKEQHGPQ